MKFYVDKSPGSPKKYDVLLSSSNWDDWFDYSTLFSVDYYDKNLKIVTLGAIKIGATDIIRKNDDGDGRPKLPEEFEQLSNNFFSLGQDIDYYNNINKNDDVFRSSFLRSLNDISLDSSIFDKIIDLDVTRVSLLRTVPIRTIINDYRKVAKGQSALSEYKFKYISALSTKNDGTRYELEFNVVPNAIPPTNIHVIIGRNGVGKTYMIRNMVKSLTTINPNISRVGKFDSEANDKLFANIVAVSFSAFDNLDISKDKDRKESYKDIHYQYLGLKKKVDKITTSKRITSLTNEFWTNFNQCMMTGKKDRWLEIISMLNSDPLFKSIDVSKLATIHGEIECEGKSKTLFRRLSSGHSIVLLTITGLVASVEQRTLVLLDEPEAHLHPPLLSAFIRALSRLLYIKNGVAIIATHSPVVLQEVPRSCVWRLDRFNKEVKSERLDIETFGGNIGTLTREVFGYEVTNSGFHRLLKELSVKMDTYDEVIDKYGESLGDEALGILRGMMHYKGEK